jgi:peptidoglycan lytic transglycosylase G
MFKSTALSKTLRALFLGVALVSLMIACASYALLREIRAPVASSSEIIELTVNQGDSTSMIATNLRAAGLIRQPLLFTMLVRSQGLDGKLQAGTFRLRPNMTMSQIISALQITVKIEEVQVTIREGLRLEEIAETIGDAGLPNVSQAAFLAAARDGAHFKSQYALLESLPEGATLEGYLFPDTYRFAKTATAEDIITIMLDRFQEQYKIFETSVTVARSDGTPMDVHSVVTMASIVQREAARADEMPKIAAVFWNRLKPENEGEFGGGRLGADPTVQYLLGQEGNWWPKLDTYTTEQINAVGANTDRAAYNTRSNGGLPPGPISAPGLDALEAAARPDASAQYLYFVASCDDPGAHKFATTNAEFQQYEQEHLLCTPSP